MNEFETSQDLITGFGQNSLSRALVLQQAYTRIYQANIAEDELEYIFWCGRIFYYLFYFGPIVDFDATAIPIEEIPSNTYTSQWDDPDAYRGKTYYDESTYGDNARYFAHPLYVIDMVEGIVTGTNIITSGSA